jgi:hypothetical protein
MHTYIQNSEYVTSTAEVHTDNFISQNRPNKYGQWPRSHNGEPSLKCTILDIILFKQKSPLNMEAVSSSKTMEIT